MVGPAHAACSASAWCDHRRSTPRACSASATAGCSSPGSATARASRRCWAACMTRRSSSRPAARSSSHGSMSRTTAITDHTSAVLRCAYVELSLFGDGLGARALEACRRADVEVVPVGGEHGATPAWIDARGTLHLDGEEIEADGTTAAIERHMRARVLAPEETLGAGT